MNATEALAVLTFAAREGAKILAKQEHSENTDIERLVEDAVQILKARGLETRAVEEKIRQSEGKVIRLAK